MSVVDDSSCVHGEQTPYFGDFDQNNLKMGSRQAPLTNIAGISNQNTAAAAVA